jgi:fructosamine-3-kinase
LSWLRANTADRVGQALGGEVVSARPLPGGCIADVFRVFLDDDRTAVIKLAERGGLAVEATMLRYLRAESPLPVPEVLQGDDDLLILTDLGGGGAMTPEAERQAAEHVAALHAVTAPQFGLNRDTVIGPLLQPNAPSRRWVDFFRDQRLLYMGRMAQERGQLSRRGFMMLKGLCAKLDSYIPEPPCASLIHGDLWRGNVILTPNGVAGFVDPAIYFADPEIELAFGTLFGTFGEAFFKRYAELAPLRPGFFETRRDIYNLYPLLVHTVLFGGGYARQVEQTLARYQ